MIRGLATVGACAALLLIGRAVPADAYQTAGSNSTGQNGAVDTSRNARGQGPTADQQTNKKSGVKTTAEIRRAIVGDKSLSMIAHNVKIITSGGKVTLRGAVRSEEEKKTVEEKAAGVVGAENVVSNLTVSGGAKSDATANKKQSKQAQKQ